MVVTSKFFVAFPSSIFHKAKEHFREKRRVGRSENIEETCCGFVVVLLQFNKISSDRNNCLVLPSETPSNGNAFKLLSLILTSFSLI